MHTARFIAIMSTAVAMTTALAHVLELPAKIRYDQVEYVRLHRTLYWNFGRIGGAAEVLALLTSGGLAWWLKQRRPHAFPLTAAATVCLVAAHGAFWVYVAPANSTMRKWPIDSIPSNWTTWRDQWEFTHAVRAVLMTVALGALVDSVLRDPHAE
jgi:hypothetical protein